MALPQELGLSMGVDWEALLPRKPNMWGFIFRCEDVEGQQMFLMTYI